MPEELVVVSVLTLLFAEVVVASPVSFVSLEVEAVVGGTAEETGSRLMNGGIGDSDLSCS